MLAIALHGITPPVGAITAAVEEQIFEDDHFPPPPRPFNPDDREVRLDAVQQNGLLLEYASARLKADREVAMLAVRNNGRALQRVSADLKADPEVVLAAMRQSVASRC